MSLVSRIAIVTLGSTAIWMAFGETAQVAGNQGLFFGLISLAYALEGQA